MFDHLIILLPCSICIVWSYLLFIRRRDGRSRACLASLAAIAGIYFMLDAYVITPTTDYRTAVIVELLYAFVAPSIFPIIIILIRKMSGKDFSPTVVTLLFTPSMLIGSTVLIIYLTLGLSGSAAYLEAYELAGKHPDGWDGDIYRLRDIVCNYIYLAAIIAWVLATLVSCADYLKRSGFRFKECTDFLFHDKPINTFYIICFSIINTIILLSIRAILGQEYIEGHTAARWTLSILMTVSVFNGLFTGYRFDGALIDLKHFRNTSLIDQELKAFRESQQRKAKASAGIIHNRESLEKLKDLFVEYMNIDKPYLDPEMTLDDAASALSTNRTYLSAMLKDIMGVTFKLYINFRRIQAAQEAMLKHPESTLSEIAGISGFASDSQLIKKFNEIMGESPRSWARKQSRANAPGQ